MDIARLQQLLQPLLPGLMGVQLTEAGQHAFASARSIHGQLEGMAREVRSMSGQIAGVGPAKLESYGERVLAELGARSPGLS